MKLTSLIETSYIHCVTRIDVHPFDQMLVKASMNRESSRWG